MVTPDMIHLSTERKNKMSTMFSSRLDQFRALGFRSGLLAALVCLLILGGTFLFTSPAHAASSNAREIAVASTSAFPVQSFWVDGKNQNNQQVGYCLDYYLGIDNGYKLIPNWWWMGTIRIVEYANPGCHYPTDYICQGFHNVPTNVGNPVDINADNGCTY